MKIPFFLILSLLSLTFFFSCTTSSPRNRGSLSDAMDKSRDDHEGSREVPDEDDSPWWAEEEPDQPSRQEPDEPDYNDMVASPSEPVSLNVLLRGERGWTGSPYFTSDFNGELLIGDKIDHWEVYLFAGFDLLDVKPSHPAFETIKDNAFTLSAGVEGRFYMFPKLKVFSPYLLARMGGLFLFWQFRNPLESGGESIESDILGGLILGSGVGIDLYHGENFRVGMNIIPEASLYGEETQQGFTNDFFSSQGFVRIGMEAGARF
ncbi:hypothetical protein EXM22_09455 [Oceanispirochaeta crateris]|uniref:Outer membrane protein beta-barrel domain-containing protein n=1 Tax=Oceanispirochaeta crateris TaxID=2518645 RepID=A0A5C1QKS1_9SPIO|nr:hypothetical protein [Oceanispirochaeta crateris]QEN08201.1 hypothetical protein EXM22_09455 [Oceanispirochaeta crateris]